MFDDSCSLCHLASSSKNNFHKTLSGRNHSVPFRALSQQSFFQCLLPFLSAILCWISASSSCHNVLILLSLSGVKKPELTHWCLCSLHVGIQMPPDEVVGGRDGCRHCIAEITLDVPIRLFWQFFSARTALFSCPFA